MSYNSVMTVHGGMQTCFFLPTRRSLSNVRMKKSGGMDHFGGGVECHLSGTIRRWDLRYNPTREVGAGEGLNPDSRLILNLKRLLDYTVRSRGFSDDTGGWVKTSGLKFLPILRCKHSGVVCLRSRQCMELNDDALISKTRPLFLHPWKPERS